MEIKEVEEEEFNMKDGGVKVRVLVVDDSFLDRKIVEALLKKSGEMFEVVTVDSGKQALEVLGLIEEKAERVTIGQKIDIILTDYCMPEMTGYDLLKAVKENNFTRSIPVVIMSSENNPQRITRCLANGAEEFMLKPLKVKDVPSLKKYVTPKTALVPASASNTGTKRKISLDMITDSSSSERPPCLPEVAVA